MINLKDKAVMMFQGGTITDGDRVRGLDPNHIMGDGYVYNVASYLGYTYAEKQFEIYNRGMNGDGIDELAARWEKDAIEYKPDIISILIGLKDAENAIASGTDKKVALAEFGKKLCALIEETEKKLPDCKIVLIEPFALALQRIYQYHPAEGEPSEGFKPHYSIDPALCAKTYEIKNCIDLFRSEIEKVAKKYNLIFVPTQDMFDESVKRVDGCYWLWDGIHPTAAGYCLISDRWLETVKKEIKF